MSKIFLLLGSLLFSLLSYSQSHVKYVYYTDFGNYEPEVNLTTAQKVALNLNIGGFTDYVYPHKFGNDTVLEIDFPACTNGGYTLPVGSLTNTWGMLDSLYKELYISWDEYRVSPYDFGWGGKMFGGCAWGPQFSLPYGGESYFQGDSLTSGGNSLFMWKHLGAIDYYCYTHDPNHPNTTPSSLYDRPSNNATNSTWPNSPQEDKVGFNYQWNLGSDGWGGWPALIGYDGSKWDYVPGSVSQIDAGSWQTFTIRVKMNTLNNWDGIIEFYKNKVCTFTSYNHNMWRASKPSSLISGVYLNAFYGGSTPGNTSPQTMYVNNLRAWYYKPNDPNYKATHRTVGDTITLPLPKGQYIPTTTAKPSDRTFTDATGTVKSHNRVFDCMVTYTNAVYTIAPTNASTITINLTSITPRETTGSSRSILKIYKWPGGIKETNPSVTKDINEYSTGNWTFTAPKVTLEYTGGQGWEYPQRPIGWTVTYTSNGTISGSNYVYPSVTEMVANQYSYTSGGGGTVLGQDTIQAIDTIDCLAKADTLVGCAQQNINGIPTIGSLDSLDYFKFYNVNFRSNTNQLIIYGIHNPYYLGTFKVYLTSLNGTEIASFTSKSTGGWNTFGYQVVHLNQTISGIHNLFIKSLTPYGGNIKWVLFNNTNIIPGYYNPFVQFPN